jgi:hypothetical protein
MPTENWFASFGNERYHGLRYTIRAGMKAARFGYIEGCMIVIRWQAKYRGKRSFQVVGIISCLLAFGQKNMNRRRHFPAHEHAFERLIYISSGTCLAQGIFIVEPDVNDQVNRA